MINRPLAAQELAAHPGCTHMAIITADDLNSTVVTTAQNFTLANLVAGDVVHRVETNLVVPFQNTGDATNNSTTVSVGDTATGVTKWTSATESNFNGANVQYVLSNTAATLYTAADKIAVNITPKTGTAPSVINKGELHVFYGLLRVAQLSRGNIQAIISTK